MKCPKCKTAVTSAPDASGLIICSKCGARLRTRTGGEKAAAPEAVARTGSETVAVPAGTLRVGSDTLPAVARPGTDTLPPGKVKREEAPADDDPTGKVAAISSSPPEAKPAAAPPPPVPAGLESLFEELRALRLVQDEILALLKNRLAAGKDEPGADAGAASGLDDAVPPPPPPVRSHRRKTVLLIDDDPSSRIAALQAFEHAEVPTRTAQDGSAGLAAIAQEKPDVIVLELGIDGAMSGKDVVNMIKATMEWVDVPIVLYTRVPIESQKEARIIHGADELVPKGPDGPNQLVARVIGLFRKG
jgi:CheY-like chemotaxis protein/ribosomal protein S27E